jgi:hypothetical protein
MKIRVIRCSDPLLWYAKHVGEEFYVEFSDQNCYWSREVDGVFNCLNWLHKEDAIITEGNAE